MGNPRMVDIHCHILPGLDDGPRTLDESLAMLRLAAGDGVRTIVATPHFGGRFGQPPTDVVGALVERVNGLAADDGLPVTVVPGCEAWLDLDLPAAADEGRVLTFGADRRYLLIEVLPDPLPLYALEVSFQLRVRGIQPILAHGERLALTRPGLSFVRSFVDQGGLVQLNADAVGGRGGWRLTRVCRNLLKGGLVHAIASDGHSPTERPPLLSPCLRGFPPAERPTVARTYCSLLGSAPGTGVT